MIELLHTDCMSYMAGLPDKAFDLAIVDPPYGIGEDGGKGVRTSPSRPNSYSRKPKYEAKGWDKTPPSHEYFVELKRVSKNQIIWGANHIIENIPFANTPNWIVWDKKNEGTDFADAELAYGSFKSTVRKFTCHKFLGTRGGMDCIHPTQKPVALYRWLLQNYAKPGQRILDTHLGSGSIAIACDLEGFDLVGCEIDADYIAGARKRLADHQAQPRLFDAPKDHGEQLTMDAA